MEYRRLNKRQKAAWWEGFHVEQASKRAQQAATRTSVVMHRAAPDRSKQKSFWSIMPMQALATPPPLEAVSSCGASRKRSATVCAATARAPSRLRGLAALPRAAGPPCW